MFKMIPRLAKIFTTKKTFIAKLGTLPKYPNFGKIKKEKSVNEAELILNQRLQRNGYPRKATFDLLDFQLHNLSEGPSTTVSLTSMDALKLYADMVKLRRLELVSSNLYKEKIIRGFCHLYSGQEAVAVGIRSVMRPQDTLSTAYRCHGWMYLMGGSLLSILSELAGRQSGCSRGKGGSMHMYAKNFFGGNGIVGASVPLETGLAFAHKYKNDGGVSFALYGDGAANQGQIYEAFNLAKLWKLPVVYVCENNGYAMGTSAARSSACTDCYSRVSFIPGIRVDGMDVLATSAVTKFAIDYVLNENGPIILEMLTYRYFGHSMSDPGYSYRSREEVENMRETKDPIKLFKDRIITSNLVTADQIKEIDKKVRNTVKEAVEQVLREPEPNEDQVCSDVYYKCLHDHIRGNHPDDRIPHLEVAPRNLVQPCEKSLEVVPDSELSEVSGQK